MLNNLTFWNNDPEFKERERKKRLEYGFLLRQQIEEEQKRKEEEKKKRVIEDLKFLNKFENRSYSNYNIHQIPLIENGNNIIVNYQNQQFRDNQNQNLTSSNNNNNNYNYYNQYNQPINQPIYNNFQYDNNKLNLIPNNFNFTNQNILNPNTIQRYNFNNDYNYEKNNNIQEQSPIHFEIKQKEKEINIQELFKKFVEEQIRVIHNYDVSIGNIINTQQDNFILANFIEIEKNRARQLLENGKNILKKNLGYFPLEINYNRKIEELFNRILNKKVIEYNSLKIGNRNNAELEFQIKKNDILEDEKRIMKELDYKSKYETIENSVPNFEKLDKMSQNSLIGFSKLVKIDENGDLNNNFLVTWRENMKKEEEKYNKNNNYNLNIDKIYHSYSNEKKSKKNNVENNNIKEYNNIKDELKIMEKKNKMDLESPIKISSTSHQKIKTTKIPNLIFPDIKKIDKINDKQKQIPKNKSSSLLSLNIISKKSINSVKEFESNNYNNSNNNRENNINNYNDDSPKIKEDKIEHLIFSSTSQNNLSEKNQKINEDNNYNNNIKSYNSLKEIAQSFNSTNQNYNSDNLGSPINHNYLNHYSINQDLQSNNNIFEDKRYSTHYYNSPPLPHKKHKKKKYIKYNSNYSNYSNNDNNIFYTENNFKRMTKLPPIGKERIEQRPGTAALIHYKKNKKRNSSSDNDSILKDLDRFRQLALNDIGYLDNNHYNYYDSRPKQVDLIPKDVIRNYDRVISSGNSSGHSKRRKN